LENIQETAVWLGLDGGFCFGARLSESQQGEKPNSGQKRLRLINGKPLK